MTGFSGHETRQVLATMGRDRVCGHEMPQAQVFGEKGKHVFQRKALGNDHITASLCLSADGHFMPSFEIYQVSGSFVYDIQQW